MNSNNNYDGFVLFICLFHTIYLIPIFICMMVVYCYDKCFMGINFEKGVSFDINVNFSTIKQQNESDENGDYNQKDNYLNDENSGENASETESNENENIRENEIFNECLASKMNENSDRILDKKPKRKRSDGYCAKSSTNSKYLTFEEMEKHKEDFTPVVNTSIDCKSGDGKKYMPCG